MAISKHEFEGKYKGCIKPPDLAVEFADIPKFIPEVGFSEPYSSDLINDAANLTRDSSSKVQTEQFLTFRVLWPPSAKPPNKNSKPKGGIKGYLYKEPEIARNGCEPLSSSMVFQVSMLMIWRRGI